MISNSTDAFTEERSSSSSHGLLLLVLTSDSQSLRLGRQPGITLTIVTVTEISAVGKEAHVFTSGSGQAGVEGHETTAVMPRKAPEVSIRHLLCRHGSSYLSHCRRRHDIRPKEMPRTRGAQQHESICSRLRGTASHRQLSANPNQPEFRDGTRRPSVPCPHIDDPSPRRRMVLVHGHQ